MSGEHRWVRSALLVVVLIAVVAGCGSSSSTTGTPAAATTTTTAAATTTPTPTTPPTTATTTSPATTSSASGPPPCTAAMLHASFLGGQGATGHEEVAFSLHNVSGATCHTYGYPGVQFLDKAGNPLPTASTRTTHDFFGTAPATKLLVSPGGSVSFRLGVSHFGSSATSCKTAYALQVIPPDDTHALRAEIPQGVYECGAATVSPLRPGGSAYQ